jgi:hypothetical protein
MMVSHRGRAIRDLLAGCVRREALKSDCWQDWLHGANRAMCVSWGRSDCRPEGEPHMEFAADLGAPRCAEKPL